MRVPIMLNLWLLPVLVATTIYQAIACQRENRSQPPGKLVEVNGLRLHLLHLPSKESEIAALPTVVIDHSLGGVEGYLLIEQISQFAKVCLYDRAGYGWSDIDWHSPTSARSANNLNAVLVKAGIEPPYILIGDSLGSYNMRLYAHRFPKKVAGMVLTDGLHEAAMLKMGFGLRSLQAFFFSGFVLSILGSALGIIRICATCGIFSLIKPQLKRSSFNSLRPVLRSFCRPKHWLTMAREIACIDRSGRQLRVANSFDDLPIVSIKARCFLDLAWLNKLPPLRAADRLRDDMHEQLMTVSSQCKQLTAERSSHFVWIDQPEVIVQAVRLLL